MEFFYNSWGYISAISVVLGIIVSLVGFLPPKDSKEKKSNIDKKRNTSTALLALLFLISFFAWLVHENYVYVPKVTNMSMDNAIQTLESNSLRMELPDGQEKDLSKEIVIQEPSEGTLVEKGSFVICKYKTSVRESYDSEGYLHSIFENHICNRYLEKEICFLYADYDRNGSFEAYAVTGNPSSYSYENAKCYEDVNLYFINSDGKITKVADYEMGYNGCDAYSESSNNLLDTGSDQFFIWEWYSGGVTSKSILYGVRDGVDYSPKCSGYFFDFHLENDHYEAWLDYPEYAHDRDKFWLMYDDTKREFVTIARTFREDESRQLKSLNRALGLKIQNGSVVNIDYSELNNEAELKLLGTSGAGVDVMVGADTSIGDFEKQLIGHRVGETFTIFVDVPDDYYITDIAGKTVQFEITVNGIYI